MAFLDFFFKKAVTPHPFTATLLPEQLRAYNAERPENVRHTFCTAPSVNMLFAQDGSVRVCCNNLEYVVGKYPLQTVDEIWQGEALKKLRTAMANFDLSKGCRVCQEIVDVQEYQESPSVYFDAYKPGGLPQMMEFLLSNTCNLECVMCQGEFSSLIRKNREKLPPLKFPYDAAFLEQIKPYLKNLKEARFSGSGEAFAIDLYYDIWEFLIKENPACRIVIQSNGTYMNARIKDLLNRGNFYLGISLDSLQKEKYEAIRINASFERVIENIRYLAAYSEERKKPFFIAACIMRNNWEEMPAFVEFASGLNSLIHFHQVYQPKHLSLQSWPAQKLAEVCNALTEARLTGNGSTLERNKKHYYYFVKILQAWHQSAKASQGQEAEYLTLEQYEEKLRAIINGMDISTEDKLIFLAKFNSVVGSYHSEEQRRKLYEHTLQQNPKTLVDSVMKYPEEFLIEQSANLFRI